MKAKIKSVKNFSLLIIILVSINSVLSQNTSKISIAVEPTKKNVAKKTQITDVTPLFESKSLSAIDTTIMTTVFNERGFEDEEVNYLDEFINFKDETKLRLREETSDLNDSPEQNYVKINNRMEPNSKELSHPLDNCCAMNDIGDVVSMTNDFVTFIDSSNKSYFKQSLSAFFLYNFNRPCDPKILYDFNQDRFIVFAQEGAEDRKITRIIIGFSKSRYPKDGFFFYSITGNPLNKDGFWFDYPKINVNKNDLFISGNIFSNKFEQTVIYQISKNKGYSGEKIQYLVWYNIAQSPFTLMPVSSKVDEYFSQGIYLIGTDFRKSSSENILLYDITNDVGFENITMNYYSIKSTAYSWFTNSKQKGGYDIDNGDLRIQDGFYHKGKIYYVFTSGNKNRYSKINFNILQVNNLENKSVLLGDDSYSDYSYPSISIIDTLRNICLLQYNKTSENTYADIYFKIIDNNFNSSRELLVQKGIGLLTKWYDRPTRLGDYSSINIIKNTIPLEVITSSSYAGSDNNRHTLLTKTTIDSNYQNVLPISNKLFINIKEYTINLKEKTLAQIEIKNNVTGQVSQIFNGIIEKGENKLLIDPANLESGDYSIKVKDKLTDKVIERKKLMIEQ